MNAVQDCLWGKSCISYKIKGQVGCCEDLPRSQKATGNIHRKVVVFLTIRSPTSQQATGNALAYSVQLFVIL